VESFVVKRCALPIWTLLALLLAGVARAEMVTDLHTATVPVANQGSKALATASRQALAEVLVKVSGSRQVLANPQIKQALSGARGQVQQYSYARGRPPGNELMVDVEFDRAYVLDLVRQAGAPLWTANRPTVLAWVVVDAEEGRYFINWDSKPEEAQLLADEFSRRGVPVQIPVFDLVDLGALNLENAWRLDAGAIRRASARYNAQDVLAGRLAKLGSGGSAGDWSYFFQGSRTNRSASVPDLQTFLRNGVEMVAGKMAARYAVSPTAGGDGELRMVVLGITSYADYAALVSFLQDLELVERADVQRVQGQRVELHLRSAVDAVQLATLIELNDRLSPLPATDMGAELTYQWRN
jgi:hypothetical protein